MSIYQFSFIKDGDHITVESKQIPVALARAENVFFIHYILETRLAPLMYLNIIDDLRWPKR